jgi:hypothetical protein
MGSCADCRYSQIDHDDDGSFEDGPLLRCHRFPPQLLALDGDVAQSWPNVTETDWCGEHAAAGSATPTDTGPSTRSEAGGGELVRPVGERRAEQPARPVAGCCDDCCDLDHAHDVTPNDHAHGGDDE